MQGFNLPQNALHWSLCFLDCTPHVKWPSICATEQRTWNMLHELWNTGTTMASFKCLSLGAFSYHSPTFILFEGLIP